MKDVMLETHPFEAFVPPNMRCLLVGSFPGKEHTRGGLDENAWFYGAPLNQLWRILENVYGRELRTKAAKQKLFHDAGIGITDIFKTVARMQGTNLDANLVVVEYNSQLEEIVKKYSPPVLCTSRFVEKEFKKMFPGYNDVDVLPSPSPRYFKLSIDEKAEIYKQKLPKL